MAHSLDSYIHEAESIEKLSEDERKRFYAWIEKLAREPSEISKKVEEALRNALFSDWKAESENHQFKVGSYYPSIIERCTRQQAYSYIEPQTPTAEELAIFSEGRAIHELIGSTLRQSGIVSVEGRELVVDLEFGDAKLHGRIDDLLLIRLLDDQDKEFALYVPLEIKSTSALPDQPKQAHYYQLSSYLLAKNFPFGVLLYWAKREGKIKAFTIQKDENMRSVLGERVLEIDTSLKNGDLPRKEAAINHDYQQCDRCTYQERCNPYLLATISKGSKLALFDIDSTLLDTSPRRRIALESLGLPGSTRVSDIHDEQTKSHYWGVYNDPELLRLDVLSERAKQNTFEQINSGVTPVAISATRKDELAEATKASLANLGVPIKHIILRENGNFDTDTKFKVKWILRLAKNYEIAEYFDKDAVTNSLVTKALEESRRKTAKN